MCFNGPQNTFLCLHENICCGYSFKVHGRGSLMSTTTYIFYGEMEKNMTFQ